MKSLTDITLPGNVTVTDPVSSTFPNIGSVVVKVLQYFYVLAGIGLLVIILGAGFTLLTSAGDAKAMEKGKKGLTNGIIGFLIVFVAYWLVQLAGIAFGIQSFKDIFG